MVEVIFPFTYVALFPILRFEVTETIGLIVEPVSLVSIPVRTPELALSISLIIKPLALVLGIIGPFLLTICAFLTFLIHVARVKSVFGNFEVFDVSELVFIDHHAQFHYLVS